MSLWQLSMAMLAHHASHVGSKLRKVDRGESSAARPGLTAKPYGPPADYKAWRWAECQKIAAPRRRNKKEMLSAYQEFKDSWNRSSEQRGKSHGEKRSHLNAHLEQVCGHRHAVWDYLQTGWWCRSLWPLNPFSSLITASRPERVQRVKERKTEWGRSFSTANASNACFG